MLLVSKVCPPKSDHFFNEWQGHVTLLCKELIGRPQNQTTFPLRGGKRVAAGNCVVIGRMAVAQSCPRCTDYGVKCKAEQLSFFKRVLQPSVAGVLDN